MPTPLAQRYLRELALPKKRRTLNDSEADIVRSEMQDLHFFECTQILELAKDAAQKLVAARAEGMNDWFLPARKTWIEFEEDGGRVAALIVGTRGPGRVFGQSGIFVRFFVENEGRLEIKKDCFDDPSKDMRQGFDSFASGPHSVDAVMTRAVFLVLVAMINTPQTIGRTTHKPHSGLQRKLAAKCGGGKFPLRAWTEMNLEVRLPKEYTGSEEIRLSGRKCLHFVRAHTRVRLGKIEFVSSHWRGDGALGIKQTRYAVVPGEVIPAQFHPYTAVLH